MQAKDGSVVNRLPGSNRAFIDSRNVVKTYNTGSTPFPALRGISLEIQRHEFVAMLGKSGSGNDPPILIADQPTGNVDSLIASVIFALFDRQAQEGKTVLVVTHDRDLAARVKRTIVLADGAIVDQE